MTKERKIIDLKKVIIPEKGKIISEGRYPDPPFPGMDIINYSEYLFYHFHLSTFYGHRGRLKARIDSLRPQMLPNKTMSFVSPEKVKIRQGLVKELEDIEFDLAILDPIYDDICEVVYQDIEKRTGKKFKAIRKRIGKD